VEALGEPVALIQQTFAPGAVINPGTEITLAEGERWLAAISVGPEGDAGELLLAGGPDGPGISGRAARCHALFRFLEFLTVSVSGRATGRHRD
jgi:hypothetical protein